MTEENEKTSPCASSPAGITGGGGGGRLEAVKDSGRRMERVVLRSQRRCVGGRRGREGRGGGRVGGGGWGGGLGGCGKLESMPTVALCFSKPPAGRTAARQASARPAALQNEVRALHVTWRPLFPPVTHPCHTHHYVSPAPSALRLQASRLLYDGWRRC